VTGALAGDEKIQITDRVVQLDTTTQARECDASDESCGGGAY